MVGIIYVALISVLIVYLIPPKSEDTVVFEEIGIKDTDSSETLLKIDLNTLTITTLKALAKAKGIEGYTKLEKAELIEILK